MIRTFNKILILGNGGSGKTVLANQLSHLLSIPVLHLDKIYWTGRGWEKYELATFTEKVKAFTKKDQWIIEGTPLYDLEYRLTCADTVIFLDTGKIRCLYRIIKRSWISILTRKRHDDGCPVKSFSFKAMLWVWQFPVKKQPMILDEMNKQNSRDHFFIRNKKELDELLLLAKGKKSPTQH